MKKILPLLALLVFLPMAAHAGGQVPEDPQWSFELKGGFLYPALDNWSTFYGTDKVPLYGMSLAYKLGRQLELGVEAGYLKKAGEGLAPLHNSPSGSVTYTAYPVSPFLLFRGVFNEKQWIVPYVGGGFTRMYYDEKMEGQGDIKGFADGYHARAGLQFLLDDVDPESANDFYLEEGVQHTYFFIETEYSRVNVNTTSGAVNLGGTSYLMGLLFEF